MLGNVSIPSSSGHQFTGMQTAENAPRVEQFQSLLHQGISLLARPPGRGRLRIPAFQSLLHQGISLLDGVAWDVTVALRIVSIPSSSGHQFTGILPVGPVAGRRAEFQSLLHQGISLLNTPSSRRSRIKAWRFQSLLHQGISLLIETDYMIRESVRVGFNPFFIRASVYCATVPLL